MWEETKQPHHRAHAEDSKSLPYQPTGMMGSHLNAVELEKDNKGEGEVDEITTV